MIYFNKLIDICINRQESQKVVDNYANGTIRTSSFRKIKLEVLIIKNFVVLQKVLQNSQHFIFIKSLFSGLNKDFLFSNISNNFYL